MPGSFQGSATRNASATAWAASQVRALGSLCTPSSPNGLVFICTGAGTTAASEPAWNTAPFPTIGTVFTDGGGVQWTTFGTQPGAFPPIIQQALDADPPFAAGYVIPQQSIADQLAWITANAGLLASNNVWTGTNYFYDEVGFADYTSTQPAMFGGVNPASGFLLLEKWAVGTSINLIYARLYVALGELFWTINAEFNGTEWAYDNGSDAASMMLLSNNGVLFQSYPASSTTPWATSSWVPQFVFSMSAGTFSIEVSGITTFNNGVTVNSGNISANGGNVIASGVLEGANLELSSTISEVSSIPTVGGYGAGTVVNSTAQTSGGSGVTPVTLSTGPATALIGTGGARFSGTAGWFRLTVWATSATSGDSAYPPTLSVGWSYGVGGAATKNVAMVLDGVDGVSGLPYFVYSTIIKNASGGALSCGVHTLPGVGAYTGWAVLEALY